MKKYSLIAKTFSGLEEVLAKELEGIGAPNIRMGQRAVFFEGDMDVIYKANYFIRTALRILREITFFHFKDVDQFYLKCKQVEWSNFMDTEQSFAINSTVVNSRDFKNSMFASLRLKDAIADYFRNKYSKRPDVNTENPDILINVHIHKNSCTISLDSSGQSLNKRGYRVKQGDAPLNEVLAAGMIMMTGWNGETDLLDPMCGSGTLGIEAALLAHGTPPGKFRKIYAFQNWKEYDELKFENIKKKAVKRNPAGKIYSTDISAGNLLNAQTNARRALVYNKMEFYRADFKDLDIELSKGTIVINPPYGERLKERDLAGLYTMIGERLKHKYPGNEAWILTSSLESLKFIGLKPDRKIDLYNGALKCKFNNYKLFSGKRKGYI